MTDYPITEDPEFSPTMRKIETMDLVHADLMNEMFQSLLDNDSFLKQDQFELIAGENITLSTENQGKEITISAEGGGNYIGALPPEKTNLLWTDTTMGGVLKYHDGLKWVPVKAVWG